MSTLSISTVYEVALTARREGLLSNLGLPPPRAKTPSGTSSSSAAAVQTQLLSAVAEIAIAPTSSSRARPTAHHSAPSEPPPSILQRSLQERSDGHDLDFSCSEGDYIALLAPSKDSHGYQFWVAEAAAPIRKPGNGMTASNTMCKVYYFKALNKEYLVFNLEERKRIESSIRETPTTLP